MMTTEDPRAQNGGIGNDTTGSAAVPLHQKLLWSSAETATALDISERELWRRLGNRENYPDFPRPVPNGKRKKSWQAEKVRAYAASLPEVT